MTMPYNLPQRKSPRATWHDYNGGRYFVTFCTKNHDFYFGDIVDGKMELSEIGDYALRCIEKIPEINDNVEVPEYVVMPNHVHMIVIMAHDGNMIHDSGAVGLSYQGSRLEEPIIDDSQLDKNEEMQRRSHCCGRLSRIIGQYKSAVTKYANEHNIPFVWQPRFHDHIIRNWTEMNHIAQYIQNNPMKWVLDRFHKKL